MPLVAVALGLAGCGDSDEPAKAPAVEDQQRQVLATVDQLQTASRDGDAERICKEIFTRGLAASVARASGRGCRSEVRERFSSPDASISVDREIQVKGSHAQVTILERNGKRSTLYLVKEGASWKIERVEPAKAA